MKKTSIKYFSFRTLFVSFGLILLLAVGQFSVSAAPVANVTLAAFTANTDANGVLLTWTTATELDTVGFHIQRESPGEMLSLPDEDSLIPAVGSPTLGATYEFVDETAVSPHTYAYRLIEHTLNGSTTEISSSSITLTDPAALPKLAAPPTDIPQPTNAPRADDAAVPPTALPPTHTLQPTVTETAVPQAPPTATLLPTDTGQPLQVAFTATDADGSSVLADPVQPALPPIQTTPSDDYPAPPAPVPQESNTAYPVTSPVPPTPLLPTVYPAGANNGDSRPTPTSVTIIGDTTESMPDAASAPPEPASAGAGRLYLWVGFLMGFLIFGTAVIGAIILFTRRNG